MHANANAIEQNSLDNPADICIVGAGPAGIALANAFAGTPYKVLLLESGGFEPDDKTQELYEGNNRGINYTLTGSRFRYFGGSANLWAGFCAPLDDIDFKKRYWVKYSGWPINRKTLDPYYKKATPFLELGEHRYDFKTLFPGTTITSENFHYGLWRFSPLVNEKTIAQKFASKLKKADNIFLITHANVTRINTNHNHSSVSSLDLKTLEGKSLTIHAKHYILACGGIENPRLLLASNHQTSVGLGNEHDLVGRYFMEHPHIRSIVRLFYHSKTNDLRNFSSKRKLDQTTIRGNFLLKEKIQKKYGLLNTSFTTESERKKLPKNVRPTINHLSKVTFQNHAPDHWTEIWVRTEQSPDPESRITLDSAKDSLGSNRASLDWRINHTDLERIKESLIILSRLFAIDNGLLNIKDRWLYDATHWPKNVGYGSHHMGTTRMHQNPKEGVVDSDCKMHTLDNLYIAGSSVFPTSGWANPTFTIVALALRLADHLKSKLS